MKLLCVILSIFVILLSTKPCCADTDCLSKQINKKEQAGHTPVKEKECAGCSPFFTCGTCTGFVIAKAITLHIECVEKTLEKMHFAYQQPYIQQVSLAIWQPPQLS